MKQVHVIETAARDPGRFSDVLQPEAWAFVNRVLRESVARLNGRTVWNVNSTAAGGGVAEMLRSLVPYARGFGADVRWAVISPPPRDDDFFAVTKRIHNMLHGYPGDGLGLAPGARAVYRAALVPNARELGTLVRPGDVVILHDPQTAGLVPALRAAGLAVIWRCHVGTDEPNGNARAAWEFLRPFVQQADGYVFSRPEHVWDGLDPDRTLIVPPSIDPFSPKNQDLSTHQVDAILSAAGVITDAPVEVPTSIREDASILGVVRAVRMLGTAAIDPCAPLVTQVSRWDRLKDPLGVMEGFVRHVLPTAPEAQLALVGPETEAVADDPEGAQVLTECRHAWTTYPTAVRARIALVCVPMTDPQENAVIVNAIQRGSTVILQKSLAEGFGLTVSEAMWKSRPVVASRVGGIVEQVIHGDSGVLVQDPTDLREFGEAVATLLRTPKVAERMGQRARQRVVDRYLAPRSLVQYARALVAVEGATSLPEAA